MWALRHPDAMTTPTQDRAWRDAPTIALACAAGATIAAAGVLPRELAAVVGVAAIHGGLVTIALRWCGWPLREAATVIVILATARALLALHPAGAMAYLAVPLWIAHHARRGRLARLELAPPWPWGPVAVGALAGVALALHLIVCASRTLGYVLRLDAGAMLAGLAYDVGANVISAELFFRGALMHELWRRWPFALALAGVSAATAVRYCLDPFVATTELRAGAAVYMIMLSILNGALCRWSGSLLPGIFAATIFFACYRLLAGT